MFQILFLVVGLAMFTTVIPEAMVLVRVIDLVVCGFSFCVLFLPLSGGNEKEVRRGVQE